MNRTWDTDFAKNEDWNQVKRASKNAETAIYYVAVVVMFFCILLGWATP